MKKRGAARPRAELAVLLAAALILCPLATGAGRLEDLTGAPYVVEGETPKPLQPSQNKPSGRLNSLVTDGKIRVSDLEKVAEDYSSIPDEFLQQIQGRDTITVERFEEYALEHMLSAQYVQRFIDDYFVFKQGNKYQYLPVEKNTPKHSYNWDNLVHYSREKDYQVNGSSRVLKGIDVSVFQGNINWNAVKGDGVDFAFIQGAQAAGVKVGVYFYSQAISRTEAIEEAQFCIDELRGYRLDLPVVFDLEGAQNSQYRTRGMTTQTAVRMVEAFCDTVENAGYRSMYYSYAKFLAEHEGMVAQLKGYDLWMAMYYKVPFFPYNFQIWQYTSTGKVAGIAKEVDMNMMFLDYVPN